jgi:excisionase family DNA binding protein
MSINQTRVLSLPPPMDADAGCSETQAATFLGVSVRTLQAWRIRGGGPPFLKLGRAVRYQRRALVAYMEARTVSPSREAEAREDGR